MPANKSLVVLVAVLGVLIIVALGILAVGLVKQAKDPGFKFFGDAASATPRTTTPLAEFGNVEIALPAGARILDYRIEGTHLVVRIEHGSEAARRTQFLFLDAASGRVLGRADLLPAK